MPNHEKTPRSPRESQEGTRAPAGALRRSEIPSRAPEAGAGAKRFPYTALQCHAAPYGVGHRMAHQRTRDAITVLCCLHCRQTSVAIRQGHPDPDDYRD